MPFYRVSGSHRDFPFDSATIDFDTTFKPELQLKFLMIRNLNSGFYVPCDSAKATSDPSGKVHINFEIRRYPLVQVMAIVILMAAALFVLIIPFTVRREALPTSVASFFFSIWSIRGIWSSEMKVFPTRLDIIILFLCVLLLLLIGTRFLFRWIRPQRTLDRGASRDHHLTYFCPSGRVLIEFPQYQLSHSAPMATFSGSRIPLCLSASAICPRWCDSCAIMYAIQRTGLPLKYLILVPS